MALARWFRAVRAALWLGAVVGTTACAKPPVVEVYPQIEEHAGREIDEVTFVISTDPQIRAQSLNAGDFDIIHTNRDEDIVVFRDADDLQLWEDSSGEETFVMLNNENPPFDDIRARQALDQTLAELRRQGKF